MPQTTPVQNMVRELRRVGIEPPNFAEGDDLVDGEVQIDGDTFIQVSTDGEYFILCAWCENHRSIRNVASFYGSRDCAESVKRSLS